MRSEVYLSMNLSSCGEAAATNVSSGNQSTINQVMFFKTV